VILVTGASGYVGRSALERLRAAGHAVTGMVRDAARARAALPVGTELRVAHYDDPSSLRGALGGISRLLFVASDGDARDVMRHHANVIRAAAEARVERVVFIGIADVDPASPFYFTPVYRDAERRLGELPCSVAILRCGLYSDFVLSHWVEPALSTGLISLPLGPASIAPVSRDDVAEAAAAAIVAQAEERAIHELTGSRSYSLDEVAALASAHSEVTIRYRACSQSDYLEKAWAEMADPWPHAFSSLCASIAQGRFGRPSFQIEGLLGRPAERLDNYLRRHLGSKRT
jgi:NAD(P)H dehydrogenase (quinone)